MFLPRIVGLRAGEIVYDGPASGLNAEVLTRIYGEEDWTKTSNSQSDELDDDPPASLVLPESRAVAAAR
jgi:phosphonate transport system ATP-binding protein